MLQYIVYIKNNCAIISWNYNLFSLAFHSLSPPCLRYVTTTFTVFGNGCRNFEHTNIFDEMVQRQWCAVNTPIAKNIKLWKMALKLPFGYFKDFSSSWRYSNNVVIRAARLYCSSPITYQTGGVNIKTMLDSFLFTSLYDACHLP